MLKEKWVRDVVCGIKFCVIWVMVLGILNVGKFMLMNWLVGKKIV